MSHPILGIDISKSKFDIVLLHEGQSLHRVYRNDPAGFAKLSQWLKKSSIRSLHACLEATGCYSDPLARFLHREGYIVSVVNPLRIKAFAQSGLIRTKTDKSDAHLIARFCQTQSPEPWTPPVQELMELQALVRHLENLQNLKQEIANRLESVSSDLVRKSLKNLITSLALESQTTETRIQEHVEQCLNLKNQRDLLISIPGIAHATAVKLLSEIQDLTAYRSARQIAAYAGLTPRHHQSGSSVHKKSRLSKTGNVRLRTCLYFPALVAQKHNPVIRAFTLNLKNRGKAKMVVLAAAMRKLLHIAYGVLKSGKPFNPIPLQP